MLGDCKAGQSRRPGSTGTFCKVLPNDMSHDPRLADRGFQIIEIHAKTHLGITWCIFLYVFKPMPCLSKSHTTGLLL